MPPICPICSNPSTRMVRDEILHPGNLFMFCDACRHGFCSKPPFNTIQDACETYQAFYDGSGDIVASEGLQRDFPRTSQRICELFQKYTSGTSFLEIGSGPGTFLHYLSRHTDFILQGNDISPEACRHAQEVLDLPVVNSAFSKELYLPKTFDMICLRHVIEHIADVHSFVNDIYQVCNTQGIVGVECPNHDSYTSWLKQKVVYPLRKTLEFGHLYWPIHVQGFSPSSLTHLFKSAGFHPVYITTWSRIQPVYPCEKLSDRLSFPVAALEYLFNRGNLILAFFKKT